MDTNQLDQRFASNTQIHNYDVSTLFIETRGYMGLLFKLMSINARDIINVYADCIYLFYQLFLTTEHLIGKSKKIENWDKKAILYKQFLVQIRTGMYAPDKLLSMWEALKDDITNSGIYDEDESTTINNIRALMSG